jgi:NitT/TauT family transport system permease protein
MLPRRLVQFLLIFLLGLMVLTGLKYSLGLSNYVIPSPWAIWETAREVFYRYTTDVFDTLGVTVIGQAISILLAFFVGIVGRQASWLGSFVKVAAYNIQAYPIVALAPIIFILINDGFLSRLLIAAMICYFPVLLSVLGIMSEPVADVEHFYAATRRMRWQLEVKIRAFENLHKLTTVIAGSATLAMAGTIVAEFIAADAGIGYSIRLAHQQSDLARILVALFLIGISISLYQGLLEWIGTQVKRIWTGSA